VLCIEFDRAMNDFLMIYMKCSKTLEAEGEQPNDDYLVDHSIVLYLIDRNGVFVDFFAGNIDEQELAMRLKSRLLANLGPVESRTFQERSLWPWTWSHNK